MANGHATWSASETARNWACPGALALKLALALPDKESEAAAEGTAMHTVAEQCLKAGTDAAEWIDKVVKTKEHEIEFDDEMAEAVQVYLDYVRKRIDDYKFQTGRDDAVCLVEQKFKLDRLKPPFDAGGTADVTLIFPAWEMIEVVDFKGGRGVLVQATKNGQTRTYAIGAVFANPTFKPKVVKSTIVQPRAGHKDGAVRSELISMWELLEWTNELRSKMERSAQARAEYGEIKGEVSREAWGDQYLSAGDHCKFCKAAAVCPALEKKAFETAGLYFDDLDAPKLKNAPDALDPARLAQVLDAADMVQDFLNAVRARATQMAQGGTEIPNYQLTEKIGRRRWKLEEEELTKTLVKGGVPEDALFVKKLASPAQVEKALGKKRVASLSKVLSDVQEKPVTGVNLVRVDKTTRPAIPSAVNKHFTVLE